MAITLYDGTGGINLTSASAQFGFYHTAFAAELPVYPNEPYFNGRTHAINSGGSDLGAMPNLIPSASAGYAKVGNRDANGNDPGTEKLIYNLADAEHTFKLVFTNGSAVVTGNLQLSVGVYSSNEQFSLYICSKYDARYWQWKPLIVNAEPLLLASTNPFASSTSHTFYFGLAGYALDADASFNGLTLNFELDYV